MPSYTYIRLSMLYNLNTYTCTCAFISFDIMVKDTSDGGVTLDSLYNICIDYTVTYTVARSFTAMFTKSSKTTILKLFFKLANFELNFNL